MKKLSALLLALLLVMGLAACSGSNSGTEGKSADLTKVMDDMKAVLENKEMMDLGKDNLLQNYGIDPESVKQFAVYIDSTGLKGDEIILLEAKDEEAAKTVKEMIDARYQQKENTMKSYQPEEYAMLKECKVQQNGNYISLIVSPQHEELEKIYNEAFK